MSNDKCLGVDPAVGFEVKRIVESETLSLRKIVTSYITIGYVERGCVHLFAGGHTSEVGAGSIFVLDAGRCYEERVVDADGHFEQMLLCVAPFYLERAIHALNVSYGVHASSNHRCSRCMSYGALVVQDECSLHRWFKEVSLGEDEICKRLKIDELLYTLLTGENSCLKRKLLRLASCQTSQFMDAVYGNMFEAPSIGKLAEMTKMSPTSFKNEFRRQMGSSPHRWMVEQRLNRAAMMMTMTAKTVSEIAFECGFVNLSHFIKLFKRHYGCPPGTYRNR